MKKKILLIFLFIILGFGLIACDETNNNNNNNNNNDKVETIRDRNPNYDVYYQIFIRSFADSNGDGIGDINGITENLDYLEELGITALWMLPFHVTDTDWSSYHGYRVKDYYEINPDYGTMEDLEHLIDEAHKRDIKIVMDLVINHTSDTHSWYAGPDAKTGWFTGYRSFAGGMVDLNKNNPEVITEIRNIMAFYLGIGINGFRFDAAKHLFDFDENAHHLAAQNFLNSLKNFAKQIDPNVFFVGEVFEYNYSSYDTFYLGLDSVFDFYSASEIWDKVGNSKGNDLFNNINKAYNRYEQFNKDFIPSTFISNHDINRIASFGQFNDQRLKQAASVMLTLPGTPHIYYGEEIGMKGVSYDGNLTEQGTIYDHYRRSPFLWGDTTKQTTWLMPYNDSHSTPTVEASRSNSNSLFNHYKTMIKLRKDNPALMYGNTFKVWENNTNSLQGIIREYSDNEVSQKVLVIHNISSSSQSVNVEHVKVLYGDVNIPAYGTVVLEIE